MCLASFIIDSPFFGCYLFGTMLFPSFALLPELISFVSFFSNVKHSLFRWPHSLVLRLLPFMLHSCIRWCAWCSGFCLSPWLLLNLDDHSRALITILSALKLLNDDRCSTSAFIPISIKKTFLHKVKAFARFSFMLLSDMLWSVSKAGLFKEIELWTLIEAWIAVIFVGMKQLHGLLVLSYS